MTKYIDLLRKHQQEEKTEKERTLKSNPYSQSQREDDSIIADMEALIEESPNNDEDTTSDIESSSESLLVSGDGEAAPDATELETSLISPQQDSTNAYGFDVSEWLDSVNQTLTTMFSFVQADERINIDILNEHLSLLLDQLQGSPQLLEVVELEIHPFLKRHLDSHSHADLVHKAMLMMLYSLKVGIQLKLGLNELLDNTVAAMLHHIGLAPTPLDERKARQSLSVSSQKQALEYLVAHNIAHEQLQQAISQFLEYYDGSGPEELTAHDISWPARMVGLLSTYETMTAYTNDERLLPRDAIREIVKEHKRKFDPEILKALIESLSLYPVGMFVQLNTGEVGQVISTHAQSPLRPVVFITMDKNGDPVKERKVDLKKQPNIMVKMSFFKENFESVREQAES